MRKAFRCALLNYRIYIRSGRIVFPLFLLVAYVGIFYYVLPVDVVASFVISSIAAFVWGMWTAVAAAWSEDEMLRRILSVKAGRTRYIRAQNAVNSLSGIAGGVFLIVMPLIASIWLPHMFTRAPLACDVLNALLLNACAGVSGAALGSVFHPRLIPDRKLAWIICLLAGLLGIVGGMAGFPLLLRAALPPLYDTVRNVGACEYMTIANTAPAALWHMAYACACVALRTVLLKRAGE